MASAAEIRNKAAKKLGLFGTGQTLRSAISADFDQAYVEVYGELELLSLVTWSIDDEVPDALVRSVVDLVAGARVNEYSVPATSMLPFVTSNARVERAGRSPASAPQAR